MLLTCRVGFKVKQLGSQGGHTLNCDILPLSYCDDAKLAMWRKGMYSRETGFDLGSQRKLPKVSSALRTEVKGTLQSKN